jgi:predicted tellurium resistance membrane protein TerC
MNLFFSPDAWMAFLTLVFLEVVLGIDNVIFLSIMSGKAPAAQQAKVRTLGLLMAMVGRIALLFGVSLLLKLSQPLCTVSTAWVSFTITGQSIILFLGGLFLLYKSATEIHHKLDVKGEVVAAGSKSNSMAILIAQILALDLIFSIDSILTAIGMVSFDTFGYAGAIGIMVLAIVVTVAIMLFYSAPVSRFVNGHPSVQMLALSFLLLIGVTLLVEAGHLAHLTILGNTISTVPKGYIYFAIIFSLLVEMLNLKRSQKEEKHTHRNNNNRLG